MIVYTQNFFFSSVYEYVCSDTVMRFVDFFEAHVPERLKNRTFIQVTFAEKFNLDLWAMVELRSLSASRGYITCLPWRTKCQPFITSNFPFLACKAMVTSEPIFETSVTFCVFIRGINKVLTGYAYKHVALYLKIKKLVT